MDFNFTTNQKQDAVIKWKADAYNATLPEGIPPLTPKQWAMQELSSLISQWGAQFLRDRVERLNQKFIEADDTKKASIETAAQ